MKIILSRKGFDSSAGGVASPIINNKLLSLPIPENNGIEYEQLEYGEKTYTQILKDLNPKGDYQYAHLDPDLCNSIRKTKVEGWLPAFGQCGTAQSILQSCEVEKGDIFLFFGWFRQTEEIEGKLRYIKGASDLHKIFAYMQIGEIITGAEKIKKYAWHPHSLDLYTKSQKKDHQNNTLYLPSEKLTSLGLDVDGYGTLNYQLTNDANSRSMWKPLEFLLPENLHQKCKRKNQMKDGNIYYRGRWQELVFHETPEAKNLLKEMISLAKQA